MLQSVHQGISSLIPTWTDNKAKIIPAEPPRILSKNSYMNIHDILRKESEVLRAEKQAMEQKMTEMKLLFPTLLSQISEMRQIIIHLNTDKHNLKKEKTLLKDYVKRNLAVDIQFQDSDTTAETDDTYTRYLNQQPLFQSPLSPTKYSNSLSIDSSCLDSSNLENFEETQKIFSPSKKVKRSADKSKIELKKIKAEKDLLQFALIALRQYPNNATNAQPTTSPNSSNISLQETMGLQNEDLTIQLNNKIKWIVQHQAKKEELYRKNHEITSICEELRDKNSRLISERNYWESKARSLSKYLMVYTTTKIIPLSRATKALHKRVEELEQERLAFRNALIMTTQMLTTSSTTNPLPYEGCFPKI